MTQRALICGVTGQDGCYLAKTLIDKGYSVWGTSRDVQGRSPRGLQWLGVADQIKLVSMSPVDFRQVHMTVGEARPDEIYFLAAQSSVGLSFSQPVETIESITVGTLNMLEACRLADWPIRIYLAGSSECFGDTHGEPADESTPFRPRSPYAVAKASAYWLANNYREAYEIFACTGILFNHESPLRPARYVTQKIVQAACQIADGSDARLTLGDLSIVRDWGWAPDYVEAMWLMLQQDQPRDFVVATGASYRLDQFVDAVFSYFGLKWADHVDHDPSLLRPNELRTSYANPERVNCELKWTASTQMPEVARLMAAAAEKDSHASRVGLSPH
jgi:GDPmannose 4,6-dehydratase